jgi:hypothetical protein
MGQYTDGLKVSIHRQVAKGKTVEEAYGFLTFKLSKALKSYEAVKSVTAAMILDLDTLRIDGWEPEA